MDEALIDGLEASWRVLNQVRMFSGNSEAWKETTITSRYSKGRHTAEFAYGFIHTGDKVRKNREPTRTDYDMKRSMCDTHYLCISRFF